LPVSTFRQRAGGSVDRILAGHSDLWNGPQGAGTIFYSRALVVGAGRRVGANDEEIIGRRQPLVTRARGQNSDVARFQREYPSCPAAEADAALTARNAEHLMDPRVIVHVVVDAIPPSVAPPVRFEQVLEHGRRIVPIIEFDGAPVDNQRPSGMVGDETVVLEADGVGFTCAGAIQRIHFARSP
jgi:hypothetical protein